MPVTKSAIKKLEQDRRREVRNDAIRRMVKDVMKHVKKGEEPASKAFSVIDKAAKKHIIHTNKAARLKSSLADFMPKNTAVKKKVTKTVTPKKKVAKKKS